MEFLGTNSDAIQAIIALLNLSIIGLLSYRGINLQNKNYSLELYTKIQQEFHACISELNEYISQFTSTTLSASKFLLEISNSNPHYEQLADMQIRGLIEIQHRLKQIKYETEKFNASIDLRTSNSNQLINKLSKINSFKLKLTSENPVQIYNDCIHGAESIWVDFDSCISEAETKTGLVLRELEKSLTELQTK